MKNIKNFFRLKTLHSRRYLLLFFYNGMLKKSFGLAPSFEIWGHFLKLNSISCGKKFEPNKFSRSGARARFWEDFWTPGRYLDFWEVSDERFRIKLWGLLVSSFTLQYNSYVSYVYIELVDMLDNGGVGTHFLADPYSDTHNSQTRKCLETQNLAILWNACTRVEGRFLRYCRFFRLNNPDLKWYASTSLKSRISVSDEPASFFFYTEIYILIHKYAEFHIDICYCSEDTQKQAVDTPLPVVG